MSYQFPSFPPDDNSPDSRLPLQAKYFAITGTPSKIKTLEVRSLIRSNGGWLTKCVSEADYLIVCEGFGRKKDKAESLGVLCISEDDFLDMLNEPFIEEEIIEIDDLSINDNGSILELTSLKEFDNQNEPIFRLEIEREPSDNRMKIILQLHGESMIFYPPDSKTLFQSLLQLHRAWTSYWKNQQNTKFLKSEPILDKELQEKVSYDVVRIISSLAGFSYQQSDTSIDRLKVDAMISGRIDDLFAQLLVQIKSAKESSQTIRYTEDFIKYSIEAKLFQLLKRNPNFILVLVVLPDTLEELYVEYLGGLNLQFDAYWLSNPTEVLDEGQENITVSISRSQRFDTQSLKNMMSAVSMGYDL